MALTLAYQDKNVRICVQQALGEGIFVGLPLALSSMRYILEKMDWGTRLEKSSEGEGRIRFGEVGSHVLQPDDDVCIVIAPQNGPYFLLYNSISPLMYVHMMCLQWWVPR